MWTEQHSYLSRLCITQPDRYQKIHSIPLFETFIDIFTNILFLALKVRDYKIVSTVFCLFIFITIFYKQF